MKYLTPVSIGYAFNNSALVNNNDPRKAETVARVTKGKNRFLLMYLTGLFSE
jgi:hypothetical protein